jgi:hypothetical protein
MLYMITRFYFLLYLQYIIKLYDGSKRIFYFYVTVLVFHLVDLLDLCFDSVVVKGVVCKKNVAHRRMTSKVDKPRILILGGALEYQRVTNLLSSVDTLLQQVDLVCYFLRLGLL